jgi:hypothetical protein
MRLRPVHVSFLDEPRNPLSNRHSSFHVILFSSIRYYLLVDENSQARVRDGLYSVRPRTLKFLTARYGPERGPSESADSAPGPVASLGPSHP